jgi:enoyl-CoA hydratase/carnithine racemase
MGETLIRQEVVGHVGIISFNRPDVHNALNDEAQQQLLDAVLRMSEDPDVRAVVIRGEGPSFCAGRDTRVLGERQAGDSDFTFVKRAQKLQHAILDCSKPVIAAVRGAAIGGGCEIALVCDMRVVGRSAKFSLPEILYGLLPDMGGTQTLRGLVGRARAKYLIMTGERIGAEQASEWGIADWLVDEDRVDTLAIEIAEKIAGQSPQAVMMVKHLVDQADYGPIKSGLRQELTSITTLFKSEDYQEARRALREKRKPDFTGK